MRIQRRILPATLLLALSSAPMALSAQSGATAAAARLGFFPQRLARIDTFFQGAVDRGQIAGAVVRVLRNGEPVYERAFGWSDREAGRRMTADAIFRIASQSKALTSTAIMLLAEEGKLWVSDPVSRFIPEFAHTTVAVRTDSGPKTVPANRPITIRDLLTHTAGISYGTDALVAPLYAARGLGPAAGPYGWYFANQDEPVCSAIERLAALPFVAQPGERFVYGYNTDILGCVVERASGMPLDRFIRERITGPLRMTDTDFFPPPAKRDRLTAVYTHDPAGKLVRAPDGPAGQGDYIAGPRRTFSGGAGLTSTARDYGRFLQMLLNGGELEGVRILGPKTVALMTTNQVGTLFGPTEGFGLGFRTIEQPGANGKPESVGTFGWGGAYGSEYEVDAREHLVLVFMVQELPNVTGIGQRLPMLVYQAMTDESPRQATR